MSWSDIVVQRAAFDNRTSGKNGEPGYLSPRGYEEKYRQTRSESAVAA